METIPSFKIDHTRLKPGIYVSRVDQSFMTFDLRFAEPNKYALSPAAMHSIEHLMATWFRNSEVKSQVVYAGPMGCLTGFYLILSGVVTVHQVRDLVIQCLQWILEQDSVPGATLKECGNYKLQDLDSAKLECARYLEHLETDFQCVYPK